MASKSRKRRKASNGFEAGLVSALNSGQDSHEIVERFLPEVVGRQPGHKPDELRVLLHAFVEQRRRGSVVSFADLLRNPTFAPGDLMRPPSSADSEIEVHTGAIVEESAAPVTSEPPPVPPLTAISESVAEAPAPTEAVVSSVEIALQFTPAPCTPAPLSAQEVADLATPSELDGLAGFFESASAQAAPTTDHPASERVAKAFEDITCPMSEREQTRVEMRLRLTSCLESLRSERRVAEERAWVEALALYENAKVEALPDLALEVLEAMPSLMREHGQEFLSYLLKDERYSLAKRLLLCDGWQIVNAEFDSFARTLLGEEGPEGLVAVFALMAKGGLSVKFMTTVQSDLGIGRRLREAADQFLHPSNLGWQYALRFAANSEFMVHIGRTTQDHQGDLRGAEIAVRKSVTGEIPVCPSLFDRFLSLLGLARAT